MKKDSIDTHHIIPLSIGGSNEEKNKIRVNKIKHSVYHSLFNNWHPSYIIRFLLQEVLKEYFEINLDLEKEPLRSFLENFDIKMKELMDDKSYYKHFEEQEKIRQIEINFKNKKLENKLKDLLDAWEQPLNWRPTIIIKKMMEWFKCDEYDKEMNEGLDEILKIIGKE
ncbi:MAG: hypothetical protein ACP5OX_00600 [Minisyncoccia bacterium]